MGDTYEIKIGGSVAPSFFASLDGLKAVTGELHHLFGMLGLEVGALFSASKLIEAFLGTIEQGDKLAKLGREVGIATDELGKLKFSADLSGAAEHFDAGLRKFAVALAEAADRGSKTRAVFDTIGIAVTDLSGKLRPTEEVLLDVADKFHGWEDGANKAAIAEALFGSRNLALINLLNEGRAGLKAQGDEFARLGGVLAPDATRQMEEFNDNLTKFKVLSTSVAQTIAGEVLPPINDLLKTFDNAVIKGGEWAAVLNVIGTAAKALAVSTVLDTNALATQLDLTVTQAQMLKALAGAHLSKAGDLFEEFLARVKIRGDEVKKSIADIISAGSGQKTPPAGEAPSAGGTAAPSLATEKRDLKEEIALTEQLQAIELGRAIRLADFRLDDSQRRQVELEALAAESKYLSEHIEKLKEKRAAAKDVATQESFQKEISAQELRLRATIARRQEIENSANPASVLDVVITGMGKIKTLAQSVGEVITSTIGSAINSIASGVSGLILGTMTWAQALRNIGTTILTTVIEGIVKMGLQWIVTQVLMATAGKAIAAASTAALIPIADAQAEIWATPATLSTIASDGFSAAAAPGEIAAAIAFTLDDAGFKDGGFTGNIGTSDIAGLVHGREFVFNAPATARWGSDFLAGMQNGDITPADLAGPRRSSGGGGNTVNVTLAEIKNRNDERELLARELTPIIIDKLNRRGNKLKI